jgi:predicted transcriptional regulator
MLAARAKSASVFLSIFLAAIGIAQPTVAKHLKILENAGLVDHEKNGL